VVGKHFRDLPDGGLCSISLLVEALCLFISLPVLCSFLPCGFSGDAKICHFAVIVAVHEDVGGLEISVNDRRVQSMQVGQARRDVQ